MHNAFTGEKEHEKMQRFLSDLNIFLMLELYNFDFDK